MYISTTTTAEPYPTYQAAALSLSLKQKHSQSLINFSEFYNVVLLFSVKLLFLELNASWIDVGLEEELSFIDSSLTQMERTEQLY